MPTIAVKYFTCVTFAYSKTKQMDTNPTQSGLEVLTRKQVAERLKVSIPTVVKAEEKGLIVGIRLNGRRSSVRFLWSDVLEGLRKSGGGVYGRQ